MHTCIMYYISLITIVICFDCCSLPERALGRRSERRGAPAVTGAGSPINTTNAITYIHVIIIINIILILIII